ncbi:MAG: dipeptidase [Chitinophagaceae bacterium]|nr:dipeptidase [Chitinophagaceae bacterium]
MKKAKLLLPVVLFFSIGNSFAQTTSIHYPIATEVAEKIAASVLKTSPIIDGNNDLFAWYFGCAYKKLPKCPQDIADYPLDTISKGETDIPRWRKGGVGGVQLNVFGDSLRQFLDAYDLLYRLEKTYSKDLKVVSSSTEMRKAMKDGKIAILPMLEGSVRLENKLSYLRFFYKQGLRCVTFTYYTSDLADGSDGYVKNNGISALGKEMVAEMNRLGIIIDMSHISAKSMSDILDITKAPVIFSHSNAKALCNVSRNVPDDILLRIKANNGIIMLDMVPDHTSDAFVKWMRKGDSVYYTTKGKFPGDKEKLKEVMATWEAAVPRPVVTVKDVADHFDYVKKLIGVDHIGIGGDYDGLDYYIKGMEDVSCYPKLLVELAKRGWTTGELKKITSENYLRVFAEVEKKAAAIKD